MKLQKNSQRTACSSIGKKMLLILCTALLVACGQKEQPAPPPSPQVNTVTVEVQPIPLDLQYSARTRGEREVEVHARVSGILEKRYYHEGESVEENALLFKIDPAPFAEEVSRLRSLEAVEKARLVEASAQKDRLTALFGKGYISRRDRDSAVAAYATALAAANAAKAALHQAELNLSYTEVRAPIAGATGREFRSEGSLVEAGGPTSLLTTIVQAERLYVDFSLPEYEARIVQAAMDKGPVAVRLAPDSDHEIARPAMLEFLDSRIDADSGTVPARAVLDNPDGVLAPGQFVVARIDGLLSPPAIYIPLRAVLNTLEGAMVWLVDSDNKVQPRPLRLGKSAGNLVKVVDGLAPGERIIVDGILKVQPGMSVSAVSISLDNAPRESVAATTPEKPVQSATPEEKQSQQPGNVTETAPEHQQ